MQASARVAAFLSAVFECPLVDDLESMLQFLTGAGFSQYGERDLKIIFVNGPIAFCGFRDEMGAQLLPRTYAVWWVQQDYTITLPPNIAYSRPTSAETPFRQEFHAIPRVHLWSTCLDVLGRRRTRTTPGFEMDEYVNWNALTYAPITGVEKPGINKIFYYGAMRAGRAGTLAKFFHDMPADSATISVSNLNQATAMTWKHIAGDNVTLRNPVKMSASVDVTSPSVNIWGQQPLIPEIALYRHSLYIADNDSNLAFHSLANRFYEVMSTPATALWLDAAGGHTYEKAGLRGWEDYAVDTHEDLLDKLKLKPATVAKVAADQREQWLQKDPYKALQRQVYKLKKEVL